MLPKSDVHQDPGLRAVSFGASALDTGLHLAITGDVWQSRVRT